MMSAATTTELAESSSNLENTNIMSDSGSEHNKQEKKR